MADKPREASAWAGDIDLDGVLYVCARCRWIWSGYPGPLRCRWCSGPGGEIHLCGAAERINAKRLSARPVVYFVEAVGLERIKIGTTTHLARRLSSLRVASPVPLRLVFDEPGGEDREAALHDRFDDYRVTGEWFEFSGALRSYLYDKERDHG